MMDPGIVVGVTPGSSDWLPIRQRQDKLGALHEAVVSEGGVFLFHHGLVADSGKCMVFWDRKVRQQGLIEAARTATSKDRARPKRASRPAGGRREVTRSRW